MNEMKSKAVEKLMMILDEVLGSDVADRLKSKVHEATDNGEEEKEEESEEKPESSVIPPTEVTGSAMNEEEEKSKKPQGIGIEVQDVKVAAMPRPGLMKKMGKKPA